MLLWRYCYLEEASQIGLGTQNDVYVFLEAPGKMTKPRVYRSFDEL